MSTIWREDFSTLLKLFEEQKGVREFRRSFEAGKKQNRLLPQLEQVYNSAKDILENNKEGLSDWFLEQKFSFTLGLKKITLINCTDKEKLKVCLLLLFTYWDEALYTRPESTKPPLISNRQIKMALKNVNKVDLSQHNLNITQEDMEMIETEKGKLMAQKLAEKIMKK